ncbi:MAG: YkvA family protein [Aureispira sp.]
MLKKIRLLKKRNQQDSTSGANLFAKGDDVSKSLFYRIFVKRAYALLRRPLTIFALLKNAVAHFRKYDSIQEFATDVKEQFERIVRLVQAYAKGEYRGVSAKNVALSIAALLYVLSPLDLIPDFIAGGMLDDLALLTWLYKNMEGEIEQFLLWEEEHKLIQVPIDPSEEPNA